MSDEIEEQPPEEQPEEEQNGKKPKRKLRPGPKYIAALNAVRDKARVGHSIDYKAIATTYQVNWKVLKHYNWQFLHGQIDLGPQMMDDPHDLRIRMEVQLQETVKWTKRAHAVDLQCYQYAICAAEDLIALKKHGEVEKLGIDKIQRRLRGNLEMITYCERGHSAILEEMLETRRLQEERFAPEDEKKLQAKLVETQVVKLTEEQIALRAVEGLPDVH